MTKNLTLAIDDDLLLKARKIALEQGTSVNELVRQYLDRLVRGMEMTPAQRADRFREVSDRLSRPMGPRTWTREDINDRNDR